MIESRREFRNKEVFWRTTIIISGIVIESSLLFFMFHFIKLMINKDW